MNTNNTITFTSGEEINRNTLLLIKRSPIEQLPPAVEDCYLVWPDQTPGFLLALADPGEDGQDTLAAAFPKLKLAIDLDRLAEILETAKRVPLLKSGRHWFSTPRHFVCIAIEEGMPSTKFVVEAKHRQVAVSVAAAAEHANPEMGFHLCLSIEQLESGRDALLAIVNGADKLPAFDLRTGVGH